MRYKVLYVCLLIPLITFSQRKLNDLEKYFNARCSNCFFYDRSSHGSGLDILLDTKSDSNKNVYYMRRGHFYVGLIQNFFELKAVDIFVSDSIIITEEPNSDMCLFLFNAKTKRIIFFANFISDTKILGAEIEIKDLYLPFHCIEGHEFDFYSNYTRSYELCDKDKDNTEITVTEVKNKNGQFERRILRTGCNARYEDFTKQISGVIDKILCIQEAIDYSCPKRDWRISNSPMNDKIIKIWSQKYSPIK